MLSGRKVSCWFYTGKLQIYWKHYEVWKQCAWIGLRQIDLTNEQTICTHRNHSKLTGFNLQSSFSWCRSALHCYWLRSAWCPCCQDQLCQGEDLKALGGLTSILSTVCYPVWCNCRIMSFLRRFSPGAMPPLCTDYQEGEGGLCCQWDFQHWDGCAHEGKASWPSSWGKWGRRKMSQHLTLNTFRCSNALTRRRTRRSRRWTLRTRRSEASSPCSNCGQGKTVRNGRSWWVIPWLCTCGNLIA